MNIEEREDITVSNFSDRLVCIETIADGNCLIHAILKANNSMYQSNNNVRFRREMSKHYRKLLSESVINKDERYTTIEEMANLVRYEYKTESPRNFIEFLRTMYNYTKTYISYPEPFLEDEEIKLYNVESIRRYIQDYKKYIINFNQKIENKDLNIVKSPYPKGKSPNKEIYSLNEEEINKEINLLEMDLKSIKILRKIYTDLEEVVDSHVKNLKRILEMTMSYYLYLPTSFNEGVIEKALEYTEKDGEITPVDFESLPKGKYHHLPFNCHLFSICKATPLMKFEFEYNDLEDIVKLGDIVSHLDSRNFIGDGDALLYVPYMLCINLIVMDFKNNSILAIYENEHSNQFVIVNNDNNIHFETVGVIEDDGKISTIFEKDSPIILECLKKEKSLNLDFLKK